MTTIQATHSSSSVQGPNKAEQKHDSDWFLSLLIASRKLHTDQYSAQTQEILGLTRSNEAILKEEEGNRVTSVAPDLEKAMRSANTPEAISNVSTQLQAAQLQQQADQALRDQFATHMRGNDQLSGIVAQQNQMTAGEITQASEIIQSTAKLMNVTLTQAMMAR